MPRSVAGRLGDPFGSFDLVPGEAGVPVAKGPAVELDVSQFQPRCPERFGQGDHCSIRSMLARWRTDVDCQRQATAVTSWPPPS